MKIYVLRKVSTILFIIINLTISANVYNNIEKKFPKQLIPTIKKIIENQLNTQISERDNIKFNILPSIGLIINQDSYNINFQMIWGIYCLSVKWSKKKKKR